MRRHINLSTVRTRVVDAFIKRYRRSFQSFQRHRAGKIGQLVLGQGSYMRNDPKGEWNYDILPDATPDTLDWKQWLGHVHKKIGFNADHYFRWRDAVKEWMSQPRVGLKHNSIFFGDGEG